MAWKYRPPGRTNWYIGCVLPDGYEYRFSSRTSDKRLAETIRAKTEVELAEGRFLNRAVQSRLTLAQLAELYLPRMAVRRPRSAAWRRDRFLQVCRGIGNVTIESITPATLDAYAAQRLGAGRSLATVKEDAAILRHALRLAATEWKDETGLSEFRLAAWTPPKTGERRRRAVPVDPAAWRRLLAAALARGGSGRWSDVQGTAVVLLVRTTGARVGEILRLRRGDVDWKRGIVRRQVLKLTQPEDREVRVAPQALTWLRKAAALHSHPLLFTNPETGTPRRTIRAYWREVCRDAGARAGLHSIRHAFGRDFLAAGHSLRELQERLGHSSIRTTEIYAHLARRSAVPRGLAVR